MDKQYDVIIIGAGIVGCAAARALSRFKLDILVVEKGADVSVGATKANSGILHAGYDCVPGTYKATYNVQGLNLFKQLVRELDIPHRFNGSLVVSAVENGREKLCALYGQGLANGVTGIEILTAEQAHALEPNLHPLVNGALRATSAGIISPYEAAIAFAENAAVNGVTFTLETTVIGVEPTVVGAETTGVGAKKESIGTETTDVGAKKAMSGVVKDDHSGYLVRIIKNGKQSELLARAVINAAGTESGRIANFTRGPVSVPPIVIHPQRGQYYLLDNTQRDLINHTIFQLPTHMGKGVLIAPTVDGNVLLGPTAEAVEDPQKENDPAATETTRDGLQEALEKAHLTLADVPVRDRITAFAGVRAKHAGGDFIVEESPVGFVHAIGIDSPGLTAAPAIAEKLAALVLARLQPSENTAFVPERAAITRFRDLSPAEQARLVAANPAYGAVVCRCETITQAEINEAMRRFTQLQGNKNSMSEYQNIPTNLDALKRRTRAQMGRCQGGFCMLKLIELISREHGIHESNVTKNGTGTEITPVTHPSYL